MDLPAQNLWPSRNASDYQRAKILTGQVNNQALEPSFRLPSAQWYSVVQAKENSSGHKIWKGTILILSQYIFLSTTSWESFCSIILEKVDTTLHAYCRMKVQTTSHTDTHTHANAHISLECIFQSHSNSWQNSLLLRSDRWVENTSLWWSAFCRGSHPLGKPAKSDSLHLQRTLYNFFSYKNVLADWYIYKYAVVVFTRN